MRQREKREDQPCDLLDYMDELDAEFAMLRALRLAVDVLEDYYWQSPKLHCVSLALERTLDREMEDAEGLYKLSK